MNVNEKGNIGLIKVIEDLYKRGYSCFTPFDDFNPVDCIALDRSGYTFRLQIKYRTLDKAKKKYELAARSVVNGRNVPIDKTMIDGWAIYLADVDKVIYYSVLSMGDVRCKYLTEADAENLDDWQRGLLLQFAKLAGR